jgi:hypothetical protein
MMAALLLLAPASALAKKKHKKPTKLGPVITATASGPQVNGTGAVSTAVASCPPGTAVIGGGFSIPDRYSPRTTAVFESYRSGPGSWTVSALTSGPELGGVTAYGYCRSSTRPITDVAASNVLPSGLGQTISTSASCPAKSSVVAGGFQATHTPATRSVGLPQSSLSSSASTWTVASLNNAAPTQTVTTHAYCLAGIRRPTLVSSQSSATLGQDQKLSATSPSCPVPKKKAKKKGKKRKKTPAQLLSAGGFSTPTRSASPFVLFTESLADSPGWKSTADNVTNDTGTFSATSQGVCV